MFGHMKPSSPWPNIACSARCADTPYNVSMSPALIVLTTVGSHDDAKRLGRTLVEERLAACVNIIEGLQSIYRWQGSIHEEAEFLLIVKTVASRLDALQARVLEIHPYDLPEIVVIEPPSVSAGYMAWLEEETRPLG